MPVLSVPSVPSVPSVAPRHGRLLGIHDFYPPFDAALAQFFSDDARQRADLRAGNVRRFKLLGKQLIPRTHGRDDGRFCGHRARDDFHLGGDVVHGVKYVIICRKIKIVRRALPVKTNAGDDATIGIDVGDAPRHNLRFRLTDRGMQRHDLAVEVALLHPVPVDEQDLSHARTGERLGAISADAADPEHGNAAAIQFFHAVLSQQERGAF